MSDASNKNSISLSDLPLVKNAQKKRTLLTLTLELTHRCNNNCVHCYINLAENNKTAQKMELGFEEIKEIIDQACSMGTLWILLSGGEPLLRDDFADIYLYLKKKGFLVSVFTNASLISDEHIELFKKYPPRDIEVSVYGVSEKIHRKTTRKNTFAATMKGIERLVAGSVPFTLKAMVMKSNLEEIKQITAYCEKYTNRPFRFDPFLILRLDKNKKKNIQIIEERLSAQEIIAVEKLDKKRSSAIESQCNAVGEHSSLDDGSLFRCQAGLDSACIDCNGIFKLCSTLVKKKCTYDLRKGSLEDAWSNFTPQVRMKKSFSPQFKTKCGNCNIIDLCMWCPAHSDLETGKLDEPVPYFCGTACERYSYFQDDMS